MAPPSAHPVGIADPARPSCGRAPELQTWAECFRPAGYLQALRLSLVGDGRRQAQPQRSVTSAVRLVRGATAGAVLHRRGTSPLPGLGEDDLLAPLSPVLDVARSRMEEGLVFATFLWPRGGAHAPNGHTRVTVLSCPDAAPAGVLGAVVLSPAGDLRGLTPRELEVLGLLVDGCTNQEIARALVVAPRTVAAHLEHVLVKLDASTRTLAAVRAEREGLLVPSLPSPCRS
ncbi:helix-turn-helix transcriptional regulator [Klenkia brasiliensis]|uniref:Regulatory protein, luxR family n=1 Tax=Klenkia brasiliensis TaxID=333142 RepID=A0A1G7YSC1_9ACTN|nr:helix-turn-helix transcriptional regulator [Klenkia brasiliensis]SDG99433.1 regulatory protein, luxR family [Klenkia brasiliensis]